MPSTLPKSIFKSSDVFEVFRIAAVLSFFLSESVLSSLSCFDFFAFFAMSVIPRFLFLSGNLLAVHARLASGTAVVLWEITLGLNEADRPTAAATSRVGTLGAGEGIIYRGEENIYTG